jgi:hypothetical protein
MEYKNMKKKNGKKFERGEISFLFLWVVNPLIILFYQNCSMTQQSYASPNPFRPSVELSQSCTTHFGHCIRAE